jgi:predicted nucleotidyltransferase
MTDCPEVVALRALREEMQRTLAQAPATRWYLFGSITTTKRPIGDIDLLIVYETIAESTMVKAELTSICTRFPIHLLLMTPSEEKKVKFIQGENAIEISLSGLPDCGDLGDT